MEPQESRSPRAPQGVAGSGTGVLPVELSVPHVGLDLPRALTLDKLLIVIRGIKPQPILGRVFSFCNKVQSIVRAGLPTSSAAMVMRPGSPFFKMVHPSPSSLTHRWLPDFDVLIASVVNDIIRKLDLLWPGLRLGPSEHWQVDWFLLRQDFFWTQL